MFLQATEGGGVQRLNQHRSPLQSAASERLSSLFPPLGGWTRAALLHGFVEDPVPTNDLADEVDEICRQRLASLLLGFLSRHSVQTTDEILTKLRESSFSWSSHSHFVLRNADTAIRAFESAGIRFSVSKGPGIARTYPSMMHRPFSDLDVLVRRVDFDAAHEVLAGLGFAEAAGSRQPWPYFDRWCREGINLKAEPGGSIDLHHHVPPWFWSRAMLTDDLVWRAEPLTFHGVDIPCLTPEDNLLVAALHVVSDRNHPGATLMVWRDLLQLASVSAVSVAASRARAAGLSGWMSAVLRALPIDVRPNLLIDALSAYPQRVRAPWRVLAVLSPQALRLGSKASQVARLPLANGLAYAGGMMLPAKEFVTDKFPDERAPYRKWWAGTFGDSR
jgi:hypothetical protein